MVSNVGKIMAAMNRCLVFLPLDWSMVHCGELQRQDGYNSGSHYNDRGRTPCSNVVLGFE